VSSALVVMFGLPGAGKSYVARRFAALHGVHFHEGDDDLPADMREAIDHAAKVTPDMRDRFVDAMVSSVKRLLAQHGRVVLAQTFLKAQHRARFLAAFPSAEFVLVAAPGELREWRLQHRHHQPLEPAYARAMTGLFDAPPSGVRVITNDGDAAALDAQLLSPTLSSGEERE
jgi:gluconate kinase